MIRLEGLLERNWLVEQTRGDDKIKRVARGEVVSEAGTGA